MLIRLSPAARAIYTAQINSHFSESRNLNDVPVIKPAVVQNEDIEKIDKALNDAPPAAFDLNRQVRVYSAYLQYVEVSMTGVALPKLKITIPKVLQAVGDKDKELQERFNTSFSLLEKDSGLSSRALEQELNKIRDDFAPSLGKDHGRVILKKNKALFNQLIEDFRVKLNEHAKQTADKLQEHIDESVKKIAKYYLPIIKANPPRQMTGQLGPSYEDEQVMAWIARQLFSVFPKSDKTSSSMQVKVNYKDVTYESLNDEDFYIALEKAFPDMNWDKAYDEALAVTEIV